MNTAIFKTEISGNKSAIGILDIFGLERVGKMYRLSNGKSPSFLVFSFVPVHIEPLIVNIPILLTHQNTTWSSAVTLPCSLAQTLLDLPF